MLHQIYTDRQNHGENDDDNDDNCNNNETVIRGNYVPCMDFMSFKNFFHLTP